MLNEDVEKVIASFCDEQDAKNLYRVSKIWRHAVNTAKLPFDGPSNGNTLSFMSSYGREALMPHVNKIVLHEFATNTFSFYKCLLRAGPQLPDIRKRWRPMLEMECSEPLIDEIKEHLETLRFSTVYIKNDGLGYKPMVFSADEAIMHTRDYVYNAFIGLKALRIYNTWQARLPEDLAAIEKALGECSLRTLEVTGILTDDVMSRIVMRSSSITNLSLHYQGLCDWKFAHKLQNSMPNIEYFALRSSNLTAGHLANFSWNLWPNLKGLDFENNLTLHGPIQVPAGLKKLYLAFTHAFVEQLPELEDYSTNTYFFELKKLKAIKRLRIHLLAFWNDAYSLESFEGLEATQLSILFKDFFSDQCFSAVRKILPNCAVTKLRLLDD
jgi:hypothetical protein